MSHATGKHRQADRAMQPRATAVILAGEVVLGWGKTRRRHSSPAPLLQHVLAAPRATSTHLVGPRSLDAPPEVLHIMQEVPPGGGPVARACSRLGACAHRGVDTACRRYAAGSAGIQNPPSPLWLLSRQWYSTATALRQFSRDEGGTRPGRSAGPTGPAALRRVIESPHAEGGNARLWNVFGLATWEVSAASLMDIDEPALTSRE